MIEPRTARLAPSACHRLCDKERGTLVKVGDGIVILLGHVEERRRTIGAGIVHQHIERRLAADRCAHRGEIGHVQHQRLRRCRPRRGSPPRPLRSPPRCAPRARHAPRPGPAPQQQARPIPRPAPVTSARRPSRRSDGVRGRVIVDPRSLQRRSQALAATSRAAGCLIASFRYFRALAGAAGQEAQSNSFAHRRRTAGIRDSTAAPRTLSACAAD